MSEVLSQSEIDALVASLQMNAPMAAKMEQGEQLTSRPKPYDFREKQKLPERYLQSMFEIHEEFCRRFETSLSNLRVGPVKFSVESIDERFETTSARQREVRGVSQSLSLKPLPYSATVQFDRHVVRAVLDTMLGGPVEAQCPARNLTPLEQRLFDLVLTELPELWAVSWSCVMALEPTLLSRNFGTFLSDRKSPNPSNASIVSVLLRAQVGKSSGFVEVCFSSDTVIAVMEQGHGEPCDQQTKSMEMQSDVARPIGLMHHLADTLVELSAVIEKTELSMAEVLRLRKGDIIEFGDRPDLVTMCVNGAPVFVGSPSQVKNHYGVRLSGAWEQGGAS